MLRVNAGFLSSSSTILAQGSGVKILQGEQQSSSPLRLSRWTGTKKKKKQDSLVSLLARTGRIPSCTLRTATKSGCRDLVALLRSIGAAWLQEDGFFSLQASPDLGVFNTATVQFRCVLDLQRCKASRLPWTKGRRAASLSRPSSQSPVSPMTQGWKMDKSQPMYSCAPELQQNTRDLA